MKDYNSNITDITVALSNALSKVITLRDAVRASDDHDGITNYISYHAEMLYHHLADAVTIAQDIVDANHMSVDNNTAL